MPRKPREKSVSGFYHVIIKGAGNQILFEDKEDKLTFLSTITRFKYEQHIEIISFCLMDNHVHLLLRVKEDNLSLFMQKIQLSYVYSFNKKYERKGPLFNGRFKSEPIEDDEYLLTAFRYIVRNPEKAGICSYDNYKWSSYNEYFNCKKKRIVTDVGFISDIFKNRTNYINFLNIETKNVTFLKKMFKLDCDIDDEICRNYFLKKKEIKSFTVIKTLEKKKRNEMLEFLKNYGFSIRYIERLTGVSRGIIQNL